MKKITLTGKLNFEIIGVVLFLIITVTAYNHWLLQQEETAKNIQWMMSITDFLVKQKPAGSFEEIAERHGAANQSVEEQVLAINEELQPLLNNILVPTNIIKFGYYSRQHGRIVAIGPQSDTSMLIGINPERITDIYETNTDQIHEKKNAIIWHGATMIYYIRKITENGVTIGHAFASMNQDAMYLSIWNRTLNTFLGAFLMLLICIAIFRELFVKLKKDLNLFAESIYNGCDYKIDTEIPELTPILKHIREQTEKMTRLDRLNIIGEMAASIAHEVRNPMTTVRGLLQFLGKKEEFANHKEDFRLMIEEIDRANSIISQFLALAKNKSMEFKELNLNNIIHDIYPLLLADALRNNCNISITLGNIPNTMVDQNSIRQLILNMVRNGLDAMSDSPKKEINIITKSEGAKVLLSIKDHGVGISPDIKKKLGTPFFTTKQNGTGLGLAVCYRIAQRHAATITIDSEPGQGTIFTIAFVPVQPILPV